MSVNLLQVEKPARYMGGEMGSVVKMDAELYIALAFPDVYEVGMSHLGSKILYDVLNTLSWVAAERVYTPWPDMAALLRQGAETLCTLETSRPLVTCDIVGFTLQYELACTNILAMMHLAGIPVRSVDRTAEMPLVIGGGPGAYNPEPLAPFFDAFLIGDGEEAVIEIAEVVRCWKKDGAQNKEELLRNLSQIAGVYVPSFFNVLYQEDGTIASVTPCYPEYNTVTRRYLPDLEQAAFPTEPIVPFMKTIHDRVAIEIARGCTRGCRFCQAGYIYRPLRERSPETIQSLIEQSLESSGYDEISLLSLSTGDYGCIEPLLQNLMRRYAASRVAVSLPSLRVGTLTEELIEEIQKVRKTGFTLAPEAATERLRQVINKGISEQDLIENTYNVFKAGWRLIKLYFMMGLPTETKEDLANIPELAAVVKRQAKRAGGHGDVNVAVSTFVPKPHTPFQWERQLSMAETKERQLFLKEALRKRRLNFKYQDAALSFIEGVIARGDRRLADVIERVVEAGALFDGWSEHFSLSRWLEAFNAVGIDPEWYLRERALDEVLPWDHLDAGITKEFLLRERQKGYAESGTVDCRHGACSRCGVCDFNVIQNKTVEMPVDRAIVAGQPDSAVARQQHRIRLQFSKTGSLRYLSHLEFINFMTRAVHRAGVSICYSNGFHPHPRFSFATATSVGVESYAEYIDLFVYEMGADEVMDRLNAIAPEGMRILCAEEVPLKAAALSPLIEATTYRIDVVGLDAPTMESKLSDFMGLESYQIVRSKKGQEQQIDLRQQVVSATTEGASLVLTARRGKPMEFAAAIMGSLPDPPPRIDVTKCAVMFRQADNVTD